MECRLFTSMCSFKNKLRSLFKFYPSLAYVFSYVCEFQCFCSQSFTMSCMYILAALYTQYRAAACDVTGVWLPLILMLQSCKFFTVILEAQVTQICSMDILRLTIDFIRMFKVWSLCIYGVLWRMARSCHAP